MPPGARPACLGGTITTNSTRSTSTSSSSTRLQPNHLRLSLTTPSIFCAWKCIAKVGMTPPNLEGGEGAGIGKGGAGRVERVLLFSCAPGGELCGEGLPQHPAIQPQHTGPWGTGIQPNLTPPDPAHPTRHQSTVLGRHHIPPFYFPTLPNQPLFHPTHSNPSGETPLTPFLTASFHPYPRPHPYHRRRSLSPG